MKFFSVLYRMPSSGMTVILLFTVAFIPTATAMDEIHLSDNTLYLESRLPNIHLKMYPHESGMEYDVIVKPGGHINDLVFSTGNTRSAELDNQGNIVAIIVDRDRLM